MRNLWKFVHCVYPLFEGSSSLSYFSFFSFHYWHVNTGGDEDNAGHADGGDQDHSQQGAGHSHHTSTCDQLSYAIPILEMLSVDTLHFQTLHLFCKF